MLLDRYEGVLLSQGHAGNGELLATCDLHLETTEMGEGRYVVTVRRDHRIDDESMIAITVPLGGAVSFWHPGERDCVPLPPDWHGKKRISLVQSEPMGCLLDVSDNCLLGFGFSLSVGELTMQYGVDEERRLFSILLRFHMRREQEHLLIIDVAACLSIVDSIAQLNEFIRAGHGVMPIPRYAYDPVFSTWYACLQNVSSAYLLAEAEGILQLGCKSVFIDDGWQMYGSGRGYAGCGDWIPDPEKFPDLKDTVAKLHEKGLSVVLWVAPLLVGERSSVWSHVRDQNPIYLDGADLNTHVLDPRRASVRALIARMCRRLVETYDIDGLKIDFLDQASCYQGSRSPSEADALNDVGVAMLKLLEDIRSAITLKHETSPLIEFRSPYVNPLLGSYANVLRASDCPADAIANRCGTINARLVASGRVVDSDMLVWDTSAQSAACAQQIMSSFFSVPQLSVTPSLIPEEQQSVCRHLLSIWNRYRHVILEGQLRLGSQALSYPIVNAAADGVQVTGIYSEHTIVDMDAREVHHLVVLNATNSCTTTIRIRGVDGHVGLLIQTVDAAGYRERKTSICQKSVNGATVISIFVEPFGVLDLEL
ncbi:glycoside hydrolase family 36 protein [Bifidobacterium scardovii]|uniref:Alpha-galactosidase n=1 Tax=Bifidobacterium scardovii TaxID=158787 RepID=A0A087DCJ4_9BIFI|nr:glycoside hydrolase family 36 protein [Bifidobacterium scardovii]KFI93244.1 alpha-galactosidase [Bifidobacterium scardovii]MDK6349349.1 alpha-galactosidase [Bifidobacterium scardovii]MDU8980687.1 alpha-galactosidase [Bifidobacterium scardovii]BAQ31946.1 putative glycosyl hydrolase [Bifidobacterium scardovii JCM 12489 = DSM 13734]